MLRNYKIDRDLKTFLTITGALILVVPVVGIIIYFFNIYKYGQ